MSDAATPAAPVVTPAPAAPPAKPNESETVTLTKAEHEQLTRDAARAAEAQSRADRLQRHVSRPSGATFRAPAAKPPEPTKEEQDEQAIQEDRKAERGLMGIAIDPAFREVLDADPTLRGLLTANPLAVLPLLAPDALDAEDAIALVKARLVERKAGLKPAAPVEEKKSAAPVPPAPPAGGVNAMTDENNERYEAAKKLPNSENAIVGMLRARLASNPTKKS